MQTDTHQPQIDRNLTAAWQHLNAARHAIDMAANYLALSITPPVQVTGTRLSSLHALYTLTHTLSQRLDTQANHLEATINDWAPQLPSRP